MKELKWYEQGSVAIGRNPRIPVSRCEVGVDAEGRMWLCEVSPQININKLTGKWFVRFDTTDERDGCAFLRNEVTDAPEHDYWKKRREVYHEKIVAYEDIQNVIEDFMKEFEIA